MSSSPNGGFRAIRSCNFIRFHNRYVQSAISSSEILSLANKNNDFVEFTRTFLCHRAVCGNPSSHVFVDYRIEVNLKSTGVENLEGTSVQDTFTNIFI